MKRIIIIQGVFLFKIVFAQEERKDLYKEQLHNEKLTCDLNSSKPIDIELQRISQELEEINKNFEIIKLKQEKNVKNNTYRDFLTANSELEKLRISLQKISQEIEKQDLKNDIESKKEELSEKSNVKKNISKKERLKNIQEQKELAEELSVKIQILTLKIDIMYKENELQKISSYNEKEVKNIQNENKELEKLERENRKLQLKLELIQNKSRLNNLEQCAIENIEKKKNEIEILTTLKQLEKLKKESTDNYKKIVEARNENMLQTDLLRSETDLISSKLNLLKTKTHNEIANKEDVIKISIDSELLKLKNDYLAQQIEYLEKKDTLFNKIQESRNILSSNSVQYLKNPLTKDGDLILSDRQIKFGLVVDEEEGRNAERLIDFYNNDPEHKGYPIFLIFENGCYGGSCSVMQSLINKMLRSESPVFVVVKKFAYSAAAVITTCAVNSFIYEEAEMMHHQIQTIFHNEIVNPTKLKEYSDLMKYYSRIYSDKMCSKLRVNLEEFVKKMYKNSCDGEGWFLMGEAAKKEKWVNNVIKSCRDTSIISKKEKEKNWLLDFVGLKQKIEKSMKMGNLWYIDERILK